MLKGGKRVLFAVQAGAVVHGPGQCTPGPIDCEIVSLKPNQIESVTRRERHIGDPVRRHGDHHSAARLRCRRDSPARQGIRRRPPPALERQVAPGAVAVQVRGASRRGPRPSQPPLVGRPMRRPSDRTAVGAPRALLGAGAAQARRPERRGHQCRRRARPGRGRCQRASRPFRSAAHALTLRSRRISAARSSRPAHSATTAAPSSTRTRRSISRGTRSRPTVGYARLC